VRAHFFCFMLFQGTRVRLLLRNTNERKRVENSFTLDFQLSGKIVDSNLTHPAFRFSVLWLGLHCDLTESVSVLSRTRTLSSVAWLFFRL
jgi:hypothetical protein